MTKTSTRRCRPPAIRLAVRNHSVMILGFPQDTPTAKQVTRAALFFTGVAIVCHLILALTVFPVFENMFSSVNLSLPEPTRVLMDLSRRHLLAPAYVALDASVPLLWFRFGRPTWNQLWFVLGSILAAITIISIKAAYQPIVDMMNAVK